MPADGRLLVAANLEIEEAGAHGREHAGRRRVSPVAGDDVALGDRTDMAYMNSQVTRGRGEMVVTATGMSTEVGHISGHVERRRAGEDPAHEAARPDHRHHHDHGGGRAGRDLRRSACAAARTSTTLFLTGISLAIAAIPTGLPAVVTMLLSMGTRDWRRRARSSSASSPSRRSAPRRRSAPTRPERSRSTR